LKLGRVARKQLAQSIARAAPLKGDFFRSVAFRHFHPDDVIGGEGTRLNGGRFVPVGVRAVYASIAEETALLEVRTRKGALGGRPQIQIAEYRASHTFLPWPQIEISISRSGLTRNWQMSFGAVFVGRDIPRRRN